MNPAIEQTAPPMAYSYHLLRHALDAYGRNLGQLNPEEYAKIRHKADKSYDLESLVLASPEAGAMNITEDHLQRSMHEVASRYADAGEFGRDLEANGLDEAGLRHALYRELVFDAVMQKVAAKSPQVGDIDIRLFYEMHHDRFTAPERRLVSHILITINPSFPENSREAALSRMEQVVEKLAGRGNRFNEFAKRHSECPTSMEGGRLGEVARGQLYPELDAALFTLPEGGISPIVESEMGYHVLWCEKVKPGKRQPLAKAAPRIREILQERNRRNCQKAWLSGLRRSTQA